MGRIAVINCGSKKKSYPCPAREMYEDGSLFKKIRDYIELDYDQYFILSGKYGLLNPNQIIEPYEDVVFFVQKIFRDRAKKRGEILTAVPKKDQIEWGKKVWESLDWNDFDSVDFYINIYYWNPLKEYFTDSNKFIHKKFERRLGPNLKEFNKKLKNRLN